jgi:hypothetical protein
MLYKSGHGIIRMFFFHIQALVRSTSRINKSSLPHGLYQYNVFSLVFSWFALANLWLTFSIIIDLLPENKIYIFGTPAVVRLEAVPRPSHPDTFLDRPTGSTWHSNGSTSLSLLFNSSWVSVIGPKENAYRMQSLYGEAIMHLHSFALPNIF